MLLPIIAHSKIIENAIYCQFRNNPLPLLPFQNYRNGCNISIANIAIIAPINHRINRAIKLP